MPTILDEVLERFRSLPADKQAELQTLAKNDRQVRPWVPTPGPQLDAYNSKADILFYGGQAGGAKTDLILGLAFTAHKRSLILRREYGDLAAMTERAIQINRARKGFNGSIPPKFRLSDSRLIEWGACHNLGDEQGFQGQPHDLLAFDEVAQFAEQQVRFLITWNRSTDEGQRCRIVMASNPPVSAEGYWLIGMFAPWLDPMHENPAKPGELRWFITDEHGKDREVDGPEPVMTGGRLVRPMSRTFIPSRLLDNPFLASTDYAAKLDSLPEPYRSAFRDGNFMMARRDADRQLIPSQWLLEAQARWAPTPPLGVPMCAIGVDVAAGGEDETVEAPRYDGWYAPLIATPGVRTPTGPDVAGLVVSHRRDNAAVIIDMGGGYGGSAFDHLKANEVDVKGFKGAEGSMGRTDDKQLGFFNKRSEAYWKFREALDPSQPGGSPIMLPHDPMLMADLSAPTFEVTSRGIKVEPKEDVIKKLGRSPDRGDAVVMSWTAGGRMATHHDEWQKKQFGRRARPPVIRAHEQQRAFLRR